MNKFSFYNAATIEEALQKVNATVSSTIQPEGPDEASVLKAGGIDLLDLMKEGLSRPARLVSIQDIPGLNEIKYDEKEGLRMGANVKLAEIASDENIKSGFFALHQAASKAATPQIRNMATHYFQSPGFKAGIGASHGLDRKIAGKRQQAWSVLHAAHDRTSAGDLSP